MSSYFSSSKVMWLIMIFIVILVPEFLAAQTDTCLNCPDIGRKGLAIMIAERQGGTAQEWYDRLTDSTYVDQQVQKNVEGVVAIGTLFVPFGRVFGWGKATAKTSRILLNTSRQLQAKFKHAVDFGVLGNYSKANAAKFSSAINQHINSRAVKVIQGTYRSDPVVHYLNPNTGLNVISSPSGQFISGWKLNAVQLKNVLQYGGS